MGVDRKDEDVNNRSMWTYVPDAGKTYVPDPQTGRLQVVSNNFPSAAQAIYPPRELRMNFFSLKMAFDFTSDPGETNG